MCIYFSYALNRTGTFKAHETGNINYPSSYNNPHKEDLRTQFADSAGKVYSYKSQVIYSKPQPVELLPFAECPLQLFLQRSFHHT